eukprot:4484848-Prymnesium_polylepis.1
MRGASYHHHMESSIADGVVFASIGRALKDYSQGTTDITDRAVPDVDGATALHDVDGATGLHEAAASGDVVATALILAARAPVDPLDSQGRSPLHLSCVADHAECAALLVAHNAELDRRNACAKKATPLFTAAFHGSLSCVRLLCEAGARVNRNTDDCKSPMWERNHRLEPSTVNRATPRPQPQLLAPSPSPGRKTSARQVRRLPGGPPRGRAGPLLLRRGPRLYMVTLQAQWLAGGAVRPLVRALPPAELAQGVGGLLAAAARQHAQRAPRRRAAPERRVLADRRQPVGRTDCPRATGRAGRQGHPARDRAVVTRDTCTLVAEPPRARLWRLQGRPRAGPRRRR